MATLIISYQGSQSYVHPGRYQRQTGNDPSKFDVNFENSALMASDGIELAAWYTPSRNGILILNLHEYGGARSAKMHSLFATRGYGVLSWDARAHGESGGELCTFGYFETRDVQAAINFGASIDDVVRIGAYGESMGGATLIMATAQFPEIKALVVDSPYADIADMLDMAVPYPLLRPFVRRFVEADTGLDIGDVRPAAVIGQISPRPVFIIQGDADQTVPPQSATILFNAAGEPKQLWVESGVGHVGTSSAFPEEYESRVIAFFDKHILEK